MAKFVGDIDYLNTVKNTFSPYQFVFHISHENRDILIYKAGMDESLLPEYGERYPVLSSTQSSKVSTGLLLAPKKTSSGIVVCDNPDNLFGKIFHYSKLLRKAAARVYVVYNDLGWSRRDAVVRGYISSFILSTDVRFTIYS